MSLQLQMEQMPGYLAARFIGSGVVEEVWRQFGLIAEHCKRTKNNKLLIDVTRVEAKVTFLDRFFTADESKIFAQYRLKVATVVLPEQMEPRRGFLLVARNRGVTVDGFTDFQAAEEWLLK